MSVLKALMTYEDLLRGFQNQLSKENADMASALQLGFQYLSTRLHLEQIDLFWWNPDEQKFVIQYSYRDDILMEGDSELTLEAHPYLGPLIENGHPVEIQQKGAWLAYIPLSPDGKVLGVVRIERRRRLPRGRALEKLPRFATKVDQATSRYPLLEDITNILSVKLQALRREQNDNRRMQYIQAGSEVAAAIVETPRLKEMLESVARSIVKNLGYDRIRFYLVDSGRQELRGVLGLQIPDRLLNMETEKYALKPNVNSLVDAISVGKNEAKFVVAGGKVVYVPLNVSGQIIGCMAVDNLLSQVLISDEQVKTLGSLAGQIGMAVLNARLFEDIEQQAITDGLTNLYVYRYFQQRLKEEIDRADRYSYSVALVMMDVDNFKFFNDTHGHAVGDRVLEMLSASIRSNIRRIDLAARYGGDEFILLLPETTEQEAWLMGTRLLSAIKESHVTTNSGEKLNVRVSMGVAMYGTDANNGRDLMEAADKALYWAKKNDSGEICFYRNIAGKIEKTA